MLSRRGGGVSLRVKLLYLPQSILAEQGFYLRVVHLPHGCFQPLNHLLNLLYKDYKQYNCPDHFSAQDATRV